MGYVGPIVARHLRRQFPSATISGFDTAYFAGVTTTPAWPERVLDNQYYGDVRELPAELLHDVDGIVHLAAISNDPMGNQFTRVTEEVNYEATGRLAKIANEAGVQHFVFASSCSVYGFAPGGARKETDEVNPQTAYARSKVASEKALAEVADDSMFVTALRFATACGMSDRLRLDLVLNDFVASALATGKIVVLSDGTPWRPLIDIRDMARAIEWALGRDVVTRQPMLSVNVGATTGNYRVRELAERVAALIPGTEVDINKNAQPDTRSYQVDFSLFESLAPNNVPAVSLEASIEMLKDGLSAMGFNDPSFRASKFMRLKILQSHIDGGRLSNDLRWAADNVLVGV
jgi:nucleoside-diphosphate-sugar epimerase